MTRTVLIPSAIWESLMDVFNAHRPRVERVAYLDGYKVDTTGYHGIHPDAVSHIAVAVTVPDAVLRPLSFEVPAIAMSEAGMHLRSERMTRLAQVHSHATVWVEHSPTDDERSYSQREGSISIVVPSHGITRPTLDECGIHVRTSSGWRRTRGKGPETVVLVTPSMRDYRRTT